MKTRTIAIVGAGIAGLSCADRLAAAGHAVRLFDKGRGPGGRMSTRRVDMGGEPVGFDHGAQYFTARDEEFLEQVLRWEADGLVARWPPAGDDAWVGVPGMSAPVRALADRHSVEWNAAVVSVVRQDGRWLVGADARPFDALVVAVPAEQAAPLLRPFLPAFAAEADHLPSRPCWTLLAAFDTPLAVGADCWRGGDEDAIGWAARNSAKPGRGPAETWVVQAGAGWSARHLEDDREGVADALLAALRDAVGPTALPPLRYRAAHRWRYARTTAQGCRPLWDEIVRMGACGDWRGAPRVEAAWLSGAALAAMMLGG